MRVDFVEEVVRRGCRDTYCRDVNVRAIVPATIDGTDLDGYNDEIITVMHYQNAFCDVIPPHPTSEIRHPPRAVSSA